MINNCKNWLEDKVLYYLTIPEEKYNSMLESGILWIYTRTPYGSDEIIKEIPEVEKLLDVKLSFSSSLSALSIKKL